jgi:hypothetical protein
MQRFKLFLFDHCFACDACVFLYEAAGWLNLFSLKCFFIFGKPITADVTR